MTAEPVESAGTVCPCCGTRQGGSPPGGRSFAAPPEPAPGMAAWETLSDEAQVLGQFGSWGWNLLTGAMHWSDNVFRLYGREPRAVVPTLRTWLSWTHRSDRAALDAEAREVFTTRRPLHFVHHGVTPAGEARRLLARGLMITGADGCATHMIGTVHNIEDITYMGRLEEERDRLAETCADLIFVARGNLELQRVNGSFERALGRARDDLRGSSLLDLAHERDRAGLAAALHRLSAADGTLLTRALMSCADGGWREVAWEATSADGIIYGVGRCEQPLRGAVAGPDALDELELID